ncbi:MAG: glycosyltransferase family 2 protein [Clostridia bacterium]|nr:glycosyltransferase family 2 protein [Clostridia bacterium]
MISIIVPIYNVEPYLCKCIDSILAQTYIDLEILLIDDGSPDRCPVICDEYAMMDSRIKVIHKINGGLSDARNAGLSEAKGEWIAFVDSDDWIEPDMYEKLLANAYEYSAEISCGGVNDELITEDGISILKTTMAGVVEVTCCTRTEAMTRYFNTSWSAWDKIYQKKIFDNIRFPVGEINEDEAIVLQLLEQCNKVVYTNEVFYHYIHRPSSITTSSFSPKKFAWYRHCRNNLTWIQEHHPELTELAVVRFRSSIMYSLTEIAMSEDSYPDEQQDLLNELQKNKKLFSKIPFSSWKENIRWRLLTYFPFPLYRTCLRRKRKV